MGIVSTEGKHVKALIYRVERRLLTSTVEIRSFLVELIAGCGMRVLGEPHVYGVKNELDKTSEGRNCCDPEGISAVAVLSTSHVAIRTFPLREYAIIDVFSCRDFENSQILRAIEIAFAPKHLSLVDLSYSLMTPSSFAA
jgi:S-adenosylmethionine/arginine decarboxylase-like enzyme